MLAVRTMPSRPNSICAMICRWPTTCRRFPAAVACSFSARVLRPVFIWATEASRLVVSPGWSVTSPDKLPPAMSRAIAATSAGSAPSVPSSERAVRNPVTTNMTSNSNPTVDAMMRACPRVVSAS